MEVEPKPAREDTPAIRPQESRVNQVTNFFSRDLWSRELASLPTFRRWWYFLARVAHLTAVNFIKDRCTWRASALTYVTVLSLVPMLALAFSVANGVGVYEELRKNTIDPFLERTFEPPAEEVDETAAAIEEADVDAPVDGNDGERDIDVAETESAAASPSPRGESQVRDAIDTVLGFVDNTNFSQLGAFGFLTVLFTVIKLLGSIEVSFNDIWGVHKARSLPRKLADYLSTVTLVPILLVVGTGVLGRLQGGKTGAFLALVLTWIGFSFAYLLMPNTRVRIWSALVGGVVGGTMWSLFQVAHVKLQVGVANYSAIYSTFAALPIFLFWVQSSWVTVLLGAEAAAAHQNQARHGQLVQSRDYGLAHKELVALRLMSCLTERFMAGSGPIEFEFAADELSCPERVLQEVAADLERSRLVASVTLDDDEVGYVLAKNPDAVRFQDVIDGLKGPAAHDGTQGPSIPAGPPREQRLAEAYREFLGARHKLDSNVTLKEVALDPSPSQGGLRSHA